MLTSTLTLVGVGILLSIALFPLILPDFWHHHFGKVSAFWAATLGIPFLLAFKGLALYEILHIILADYVPFIILLWSLYTVSGGILLRGTLRGALLGCLGRERADRLTLHLIFLVGHA